MKKIPLGEQLISILIKKNPGTGLSKQVDQENLSGILKDETFLHLMKQTPSIVGIFNFGKNYFEFFNEAVKHEWGYTPSELTGQSNVNFTMDICVPEHGEIFVNNFVADVMDAIIQYKGSVMDIVYTICLQLRKKNGSVSWYYMETNILSLNEHGMPAYSIFNAINVDDIKKDSYLYYFVRSKRENDYDELILSKALPVIKDDCILSTRELQVLRYVQQGFSTAVIADKLSISTHTVQSHRKNILSKTNSENTADLLALAMLRGWI